MSDSKKPIFLPKVPYLPFTRTQNPAPLSERGQQGADVLQEITNSIMRAFQQVLPSNYVGEVPGPYYLLQFEAIAEQLASLQLTLEDIQLQSDVDFARPEFLWQMIGTLVFPDTNADPRGIPEISGDLSYREFLRRMVYLLLQGAKKSTVKEGLELLTDGIVEIIAKVEYSNDENSFWGLDDQNTYEINIISKSVYTAPDGSLIEGFPGTGFPTEPFRLLRNNMRVIRALQPAKALYEYRHLFLDVFHDQISAETSWAWESWYYGDFRKFFRGMKEITGNEGVTLSDKSLFQDITLDFSSIDIGASLQVLTGPNALPTPTSEGYSLTGYYRVEGVYRTPYTEDLSEISPFEEVPRPYVTSPTGLTGKATLGPSGIFTDPSQDFSYAVEGEALEILEGPNRGRYRMAVLTGNPGGPVGILPQGSGNSSVQVASSILKLSRQMPFEADLQGYKVSLQRLGVKKPSFVKGESASTQFYP